MKPIFLKRIRFLLSGIFLLAAAAGTQAQQTPANARFARWDKDSNHKLTHAEFYEGMKEVGVFEVWDKNGDMLLNRQEVYAGRTRMQKNEEKRKHHRQAGTAGKEGVGIAGISLQEGSFSFWESEEEAGFSFREVDLNRDGTLDKTEFFTALFRLWDREDKGYLRKYELKEENLKKWRLL